VRLTVARYYTPTDQFKSRIQMAMKSILKNQNLVLESYMKKSIKVVDSLKFKTQKEKIVYGGGGIVPDVLCPESGIW
jgi:carboxyl-terminal processing protease